jgi:hypothetical protein
METPILRDPSVYPDDAVLTVCLGASMPVYNAVLDFCRSHQPAFEATWNYYNDGKSWLFQATSKKKTLFWLSAGHGLFRTTFYLGSNADQAVESAGLPEELVAQFHATAGKKFRGLTLELRAIKDLEIFAKLLALKVAAR